MTEETHLKARGLYSQIAHLNSQKQRLLSWKICAVLMPSNEGMCRRQIEYKIEITISDEMALQIRNEAIKKCDDELKSLQEQFEKL